MRPQTGRVQETHWNYPGDTEVDPATEAHAAGVLGTFAEGCETPERAV